MSEKQGRLQEKSRKFANIVLKNRISLDETGVTPV